MSVGIASYPENVPDPKLLSKNALTALNRAHEDGGNRASIYRSQ
jgi:GGDEF domain-containing protein